MATFATSPSQPGYGDYYPTRTAPTNQYGDWETSAGQGATYSAGQFPVYSAAANPYSTGPVGGQDYAGRDAYTQTVTAPTGQAFNAGTSVAAGETVPNRYSQYLTTEYGQQGYNLPKDQYGRTAYDIQRENVNVSGDSALNKYGEYLKSQFAGQGLGDSGIYQKAAQEMAMGLAGQRAQQLGDIGIAEAEDIRAQQERLGAQAFEAEQASAGRAVQWADLSLREKSIAEQARQFDNTQDLQAWMKTQDITDAEADRVLNWFNSKADRQQRGEFFYEDLNQKDKAMFQDLWKFNTEMDVRIALEKMNLDDASKERLFRAWSGEKDRALQQSMQYAGFMQQNYYQAMGSFYDIQKMGFQDALAQDGEVRKMQSTAYYNMGASGQTIPDAQLAVLQQTDPLAYQAYQAGKGGMQMAEWESNFNAIEQYRKTLMLSTDPTDSNFIEQVNSIFRGKVPDEMLVKPSEAVKPVSSVADTVSAKTGEATYVRTQRGWGNDAYRYKTLDAALDSNMPVVIDGVKYTVSDARNVNVSGTDDSTIYTLVGPDGTMRTITAKGGATLRFDQ